MQAQHYLGDKWLGGARLFGWGALGLECKALLENGAEYGLGAWKTGLSKLSCLKALAEADLKGSPKVWPIKAPKLYTAKCKGAGSAEEGLNPSGEFVDFRSLVAAMLSPQVAVCTQVSQPLVNALYGEAASEVDLDAAWAAVPQISGSSHEQQLSWKEELLWSKHIPVTKRACWLAGLKQEHGDRGVWHNFPGMHGAPPCGVAEASRPDDAKTGQKAPVTEVSTEKANKAAVEKADLKKTAALKKAVL